MVSIIIAIPAGKKSLKKANNGMIKYLFKNPKIPQPKGIASSKFLS